MKKLKKITTLKKLNPTVTMIKQAINLFIFLEAYLANKLPIKSFQVLKDEIILVIEPQKINLIINFLRYHLNSRFEILACISGTDYPERLDRFEISYELLSVQYNVRIRLKTYVNEKTCLSSTCNVFSSANWYEREIFDLLGVSFFNHVDLRRILTDYGFEDFPLRKDFPLSGFVEVRFDEKKKRVVCESIEYSQQFRHFNFESPWVKSLT